MNERIEISNFVPFSRLGQVNNAPNWLVIRKYCIVYRLDGRVEECTLN